MTGFNVPGAVQRDQWQPAERERHTCLYCGHDGGRKQVAKLDEVVGVSGWACTDRLACSRRIKKRAAEYCTGPLNWTNGYF